MVTFNARHGNPLEMMRITATAKGRVQGVGYRYYVRQCAEETGVCGYAKNMPDGSVLIVAEGNRQNLDVFTRMLWATGNLSIRVDDLFITHGEVTGEFSSFGIR
jgi:acylphosphatase